jgi:putative ABC transport system substrate-binding protein
MSTRRSFITLLGGAVAWPLAARGQQRKLPRIGVLVTSNPEPFWTELQTGLRERGYIEGQTIAFEFRSADSRLDVLRGLADDLVRLRVDIIVAWLTPAVIAARQATTEIPIVMVGAGDPVGLGLVSTLARPGGNITGLSGAGAGAGVKVLELIHEIVPTTRGVAALANMPDPFSRPFVEQIEEAGRALGIAIQTLKLRGVEDYDAAFAAMEKERVDAAIVQPSLPRPALVKLALKRRLPLAAATALAARDGFLFSYSLNQNELYRRAAYYIERILKGAKPADLPVELPTRYELIVNLKTAKALGLDIPASVLARADEVIE